MDRYRKLIAAGVGFLVLLLVDVFEIPAAAGLEAPLIEILVILGSLFSVYLLPNTGPTPPAVLALLFAFGTAPWWVGCASFAQTELVTLSTRWSQAPIGPVSVDECDAMDRVQTAVAEGPDRAARVIGRAGALEDMGRVFAAREIQCRRAVLLQAEGKVVDPIRVEFVSSWTDLGEVAR
jgi:hypothetical protein